MDFFELFANIPIAALVLFGVGIILLIVEMCMPGFGVAGVSGLVVLALAIIFAADTFLEGLVFTGVVLAVVAVIAIVFFVLLSKGKLSANFILKAKNSNDEGFSSAANNLNYLVGREGVAQTTLRPAGRVSIENQIYDVVTSGDYIASGDLVRVIEVHGNHIVVAPAAVAHV